MSQTVSLSSGRTHVELALHSGCVVPLAPRPGLGQGAPIGQRIVASLQAPLELPPLSQCVVPGDRVVIVADPETPHLPEILTAVWEQLSAGPLAELAATLLLPPDSAGGGWQAFQELLPEHLRRQISVHIHDLDDETQRSYLASSAAGERIYLASSLVDADLIVNVGMIAFSGTLGYGGTTSSIYPALSDAAAIRGARRVGHAELTPDDKRPLRELVDEIGWLLGLQFAFQVVPATDGFDDTFVCGAIAPVMQAGQAALNEQWRISLNENVDLAVVSVPGDRHEFDWKHIGAAVENAARLVSHGGRIAIVADCQEPAGPALQMLRRCNEPDDLLRPLRLEPPVDAVEAAQLIHAQQRCRIGLLSSLSETVVEDLGLLAISSQRELQRLVDVAESVAVVPNANFAWTEIVAEESYESRKIAE